MKLFMRKVPVFWLLIAIIVILCCAVQLSAEYRFHSSEQSRFIQSLMTDAEGINQNLVISVSKESNAEEVEQALIGARLYSEHLTGLADHVPRYTVFGHERGLFDELGNPSQAFSYVALQLNEVLNNYQETHILSAEDRSTVLLISDAFSTFCDHAGRQNKLSQRALINCIDTLCTAIYR